MGLSKYGGIFNAANFAYGINPQVGPLQVVGGPNATGSGTLTLAFGYFNTADGLTVTNPLNTNAPINVGGNSNTETVTPSATSNTTPTVYSSATLTATFTYLHGNGDQIRSGTCGFQEALNYVGAYGGGLVIVDRGWVALGGTQSMIVNATYPANVGFWDNRYGSDYGPYTYTLTSTQVLNMATTGVELLPPPGANSYWQVQSANLISLGGGTAYTGGSAITIGYGSTTPTNALSGTIAATLLTTGTAVELIEVGSGLTSLTAGTAVLNKGIYITNTTTAFAAGTGSVQVVLNVANITT